MIFTVAVVLQDPSPYQKPSAISDHPVASQISLPNEALSILEREGGHRRDRTRKETKNPSVIYPVIVWQFAKPRCMQVFGRR
jgi:hypothetical protein